MLYQYNCIIYIDLAMKKFLCKIFSYKVWSYAAAIVTVLMVIPALKECMKKPPTIDVSVGKYWVTDEEKVTLLYVVPNTAIDKYLVPIPLSFSNNGETAIHNFSGRLSTELLKIGRNDNKDAYMRRFLNGDEHLENHIQNIYVKSASMVGKGKIELSLEVKDNNARIKISNNGEAISREKQNAIFEEGFTTKPTGSGLGLHICATNLKAQNASLKLNKSTKDLTEFEIDIPVNKI